MTLIAALSHDNVWALFGDLLLTGKSSKDHAVWLPSQKEHQVFFENSGWSVLGFAQKICMVGPNCAIAWSGEYVAARLVIRELQDRAAAGALTLEGIQAYLDGEPELKKHKCAFIGLVEAEGRFGLFGFDVQSFNSPSLGQMVLDGSGSATVYEFSRLMSRATVTAGETTNPLQILVSKALIFASLLLRSEFQGGDSAATILQLFGGGYELAFHSDGHLHKLDAVTFVFWDARVLQDRGELSHPQFLVTQKYAAEHLLIRSAHRRRWHLHRRATRTDPLGFAPS